MPFEEQKSKLYNHMVRVLCDKIPRKLLYKLLVHGKYDIEIACDDAISARVIGGSTNKRSKKILWEHMDVVLNESSATYYSDKKVKWFFGPFDQIVGVSKYCANRFVEKYGFDEKVTYVYNPIDIDKINAMSLEEAQVKMNENNFNILMIGGLVKPKGYPRMIDVFARIKQKNKDCKLYIIGEGEMREYLEKEVEKHGLNGEVILLGFIDNPYPYIKKADLFVCGSLHESYCLAVAESMVLGKAIVSTKCAGPMELLDNGKYGMLVDNTEEGLYRGILTMVENRNKIKSYEQKVKQNREFFGISKIMEQWETLLN